MRLRATTSTEKIEQRAPPPGENRDLDEDGTIVIDNVQYDLAPARPSSVPYCKALLQRCGERTCDGDDAGGSF